MASNIPAKLKAAGITPFVVRGNQLRTAKPVVSYWCDYWVVNQILAKQLHNADEECLQFTTAMMDQLEEMKANNQGNTAILDDNEGRAYVEQFAQETLDRAMRPLKANKVTQQTAVTFEAAATFLQLINIWGAPGIEVEKKIKFAKWNAARILRAIKEGKDPNESNPQIEEEEEKVDEDDPELQAIMAGQAPKAATVEDAPDEEGKGYLNPSSAAGGSAAYSPGPVSAPTSPPQGTAPAPEQVSPITQPTPEGYFPSAPTAADDDDPPLELPSAPAALGDPDVSIPSPPATAPSAQSPSNPDAPNLPDTPQGFYRPTPSDLSTPFQPPQQPPPPTQPTMQSPPPASFYQPPPSAPQQPAIPTFSAPAPQPLPAAQTPQPLPPTNVVYNADDMAQAQAQKHAKWAISALNFEDVPTAVRELKAALAALGVQ
ncbi:hypothetical protein G7054_g15162 [Neopestalotiopsis clavispora]|nr:hypothetical protein G7054_g15162 [Neopestalotiopsis clavispora]